MAIDEKKLIEDIDNCVVGLTNLQMMQITDIIETQPKVNEWIPCSESLPKKPEFGEDSYLVQSKIIKTPYTAYWVGEKWSDVLEDTILDVIAYMPLPEPYKEGLK